MDSRLERERFFLNVQQKSAEGNIRKESQSTARQSRERCEGLNDRRGKYVAQLKGAKRQKNQLELAFGEADDE